MRVTLFRAMARTALSALNTGMSTGAAAMQMTVCSPTNSPKPSVEHGERRQHPVLLAVALLFESGEQVAGERVDRGSREHHRLGVAGGPARAHIHRGLAPVAGIGLEGYGAGQTEIAVSEEGAHHPLHTRQPFAETFEIDVGKKNDFGTLLSDRSLKLPPRHQRMDHGRDRPETGDRIKRDDALLHGGEREHDHVTSLYTHGGKPSRHSFHLAAQSAEGHMPAPSDKSRPPVFLGAVGKHIFVKRHPLRYHSQIIKRTRARSQYANPSCWQIK